MTRIAGANRFDTSVRVARATTDDPRVIFLADGGDFPDAVIAGAAAPRFDGVTVLTTDERIPVEVEAYIAAHPDAQVYAVGNGARAAAPDAPAAAGATPYVTSALLAQVFDGPTEVVIANGERFPDGLAGGAYAAQRGAPLLLSPTDALDTPRCCSTSRALARSMPSPSSVARPPSATPWPGRSPTSSAEDTDVVQVGGRVDV
ncbi:MAG TPA: cell wall-binding repeat-containing protein [Euzebya sp.]|nr:cell wall-binding repeat-containing protein [Euzebya sp.]